MDIQKKTALTHRRSAARLNISDALRDRGAPFQDTKGIQVPEQIERAG